MMKKMLLVIICFALALPVYADVIIEPDDSFYSKHRGEMVEERRDYYVNGENGWLAVAEKPGSKQTVWTVQNGEFLHIMYVYADGWDLWGIVERRTADGENWESGWVPMEKLSLKYDHISFRDEYGDLFTSYTGDYATVKAADKLVLWTWPGSGEIAAEWNVPANMEWNNNILDVQDVYTDTDGREWGNLIYWSGIRGTWLCLDDPSNTAIPAFHPAPAVRLNPAATPDENAQTGDGGFPWLAVGLVAGVMLLTVILIRVFWKPKTE